MYVNFNLQIDIDVNIFVPHFTTYDHKSKQVDHTLQYALA